MHDLFAIRRRALPLVTLGARLIAVLGMGAALLPARAEDKAVGETFQHEVCDVGAIFSRLSGTTASGTQHISPIDNAYRNFALDIARRNGFEDPRVIGGAMNGRAAFV